MQSLTYEKKNYMKMASSLPASRPLALVLSLLTTLPLFQCDIVNPDLVYHGGPTLTGNLNLSILWYGEFSHAQKSAIIAFLESLNYNCEANLRLQVSTWWKMVESYQSFARDKSPGTPWSIHVQVVKQDVDTSFSAGKNLTQESIKILVDKATAGTRDTLAIIFTAQDVGVEGICAGKCSQHGAIGKKAYIMVANPVRQCPGECAWPFHRTDSGPQGVTLQPPSGDIGADAMVVSLAAGLAEAVTNPFKTGFFAPVGSDVMIEAASACPNIFGSQAFPGYTGKAHVDPRSGGAFNAHGIKDTKFLLPAIWNPKTSSCWTLM